MKMLYLIRHCQAEGQAPDAPLTPLGREQANQLASFFQEIAVDRIVSSPFLRARQSVELLALAKHLPVETDDRLTERVLSGNPLDNWLEQLRQSFDDLDLCLEGGESNRTAMNRAIAAIDSVLSHEAVTTLIVTHGALMTLLLKNFDNRFGFTEWSNLSNPDVYQICVSDDQATVRRVWA
ncbi:MAG: histidine phosphatase family protein [Clostridia bacterium]